MFKKTIPLIFAVLVVAANYVNAVPANSSAGSEEIKVPPCVLNCTSNACSPIGARCATLIIPLPLNADVQGVHCFTTAHYPDDTVDVQTYDGSGSNHQAYLSDVAPRAAIG